MLEQQGRNQGRLERERQQRKPERGGFGLDTKSRETWREGNKGGEDGRLGVPSEHTTAWFARRRG